MIWRQCQRLTMMNPMMMPTYYSTLFNSFRALLSDEHITELDAQVAEIERWLSDDYNKLTLVEIEYRMFQNMDLLSGFMVNGQFITQMEINQRLEQIRMWLQGMLWSYLPYIRLSQQLAI